MTFVRKQHRKRSRAPGAPPIVSSRRVLELFAATDLDRLIDASFRLLAEAVSCDFVSAFYRSSHKGPLKERNSRGREYGPEFLRRYIELTPTLPVARANPGIKILTTRAILPRSEDELKRSDFYREIMQTEGWRHAVALCFWSEPPADLPVLVTSVNRREGGSDFSEAEIARLKSMHAFVSCAVSRLQQLEAAHSARDGMATTVRHGVVGVAVLDWNLCVVEATAVARRLCAAWSDGASRTNRSRPEWQLPGALAAACRELRSEWQDELQANPDAAVLRRRAPIPHPRLPGLSASIAMICRRTIGLSEPTFVLELEKLDKPEPVAVRDPSICPASTAGPSSVVPTWRSLRSATRPGR